MLQLTPHMHMGVRHDLAVPADGVNMAWATGLCDISGFGTSPQHLFSSAYSIDHIMVSANESIGFGLLFRIRYAVTLSQRSV